MATGSPLVASAWVVASLLALTPLTAQAAEETTGSDDEVLEQSSERPTLFFESVDVDLINLQVVVTDKDGQPVVGLTRDDFQIFENGREMEVNNFYAVASAAPKHASESGVMGEARALPLAGDTKDKMNVVVLVDNLNIQPENRKRLFLSLREFFRDAPDSGLRVMVASLGRKLEVALPFSDDWPRVLEVLDEVEGRESLQPILDSDRRMFMNRLQTASLRRFIPRRRVDTTGEIETVGDPHFDDAVRVALQLANSVQTLAEQRYQQVRATVDSIERFCGALGGIPGRKALVYLSDGLPLRPADSLYEAWTGKFQHWVLMNEGNMRERSSYPEAPGVFSRVMSSIGSTQFDLSKEVRELTMEANDNRVVLYPISDYRAEQSSLSASVAGGGISSGSGSMMRASTQLESFGRDSTLLILAEDTGGLAMTRSNNLNELLNRATRDFRTLYSLGYQPPNDDVDELEPPSLADERAGKEMAEDTRRRIEVKVRRDGVTVRHGRGYSPKNWRQQLGAMTTASAWLDVEENPLQVRVEPLVQESVGERIRVPIMLTVPFELMRMVHLDGYYTAQLTALVMVQDEHGGLSETTRIDLPVRIPDWRILEALAQVAGYVIELEVDRGPTRVALGVRDHFGRVDSTVKLDFVADGKPLLQ